MKSRRDWDRKQKQNEVEINELQERVKLASTEMEKLRRENDRLMGLREEEHQKETETNRCTETREIGKIEGRLHGGVGVGDAHTHTHAGSGGKWGRAATACRDPRERRETLCSLEVDHDQAGPVVPREVDGTSAVDGCTRSLGGIEAPGTLEVARFPITSVVPVCVVSRCVCTRAWRNAC